MRILAVTADASLLTALTSMMLDWEIKGVRDPQAAKELSEGAQVVLVDSGSTARGIDTAKALWTAGITLPSLVIGDTSAPEGAHVRVIVRPFSLQDLTSAVDEVSTAVAMDPRVGGDDGAADAEPAAAEESASPALQTTAAKIHEALQDAIPAHEPAAEAPQRAAQEPHAFEPEPHEPEAPRFEPEPAFEPEPMASVTHLPVQPAAEPGGIRRLLRRREGARTAAEAAVAEDPMLRRLKNAIDSMRDLDELVSELPVLAQPRAMAHAFLAEVVEMFSPQVAAVYAALPDGSYGVIAAHGLSNVEAGMRVPPDQELFMDMSRTLEAVLIAPVDLAQGLVAGIGGARTEALMAAPLAVNSVCHAIVIVGRQDFTEFDLDLLSQQADEAAPGLAVAQMIDRIRGL